MAFFLLSALFLVSCQNSKKEIQDLNSRNLGVEVVKNVDINYTLGGRAKAKLLSPLMLRVQENVPYVEFPNTLHVDFFSEAAVVESMLDAKYGKYTEAESKVYLRDSVKFIGLENGDTLYCDELYWDRNRPVYQFYTDKPVQIRTKSQIIYGEGGFETNQDFTEKVVKKVVNSIIRVPTSQFPVN
ncbi:MAG TPA: hypothetical protein VK489_14915 [Ferruginibacter sp.]|nr:hypothetical protein [Ferruginibacter sp.]